MPQSSGGRDSGRRDRCTRPRGRPLGRTRADRGAPPGRVHRAARRGCGPNGVPAVVRERQRLRDRRGPRPRGHRRDGHRPVGARAAPCVVGRAAPHRDLFARSRRPRLRRPVLRGGGPRQAACDRARERAEAVRPVRAHRGLQRRDQPAAVPGRGAAVADRVPLPRRDVFDDARLRGRRRAVRADPREGRDRRPHVDVGAEPPRPLLRRPLHLGNAERRQPAEGAALPARLVASPSARWQRSTPR